LNFICGKDFSSNFVFPHVRRIDWRIDEWEHFDITKINKSMEFSLHFIKVLLLNSNDDRSFGRDNINSW